MSGVSFTTGAYAKIVLHCTKYPYSTCNGVLLADKLSLVGGAGTPHLHVVDSVALFHHTYCINAMSDVAINQIDKIAIAENRIIVGYYASCENFREYCVQSCVGQHVAKMIVQRFPGAVFIVVHNKRMMPINIPTIKVHKYIQGSWTFQESKKDILPIPSTLGIVASLLQDKAQKDIVDFENFFDNNRLDWTNKCIDAMITNMSHPY